jgi:hypothetical protein
MDYLNNYALNYIFFNLSEIFCEKYFIKNQTDMIDIIITKDIYELYFTYFEIVLNAKPE